MNETKEITKATLAQRDKDVLEKAEEGCAHSQMEMAWILSKGLRRAKKDPKKALEWQLKAAQQGDMRAIDGAAWMCFLGKGAKVDYPQAYKLWDKAAGMGYEPGQMCVGYMLEHGLGVRKSARKAQKWYKSASTRGHNVEETIKTMDALRRRKKPRRK